MAATGKFIHNSSHGGLNIACTNAYATARRHQIPINSPAIGTLTIPGLTAGRARLSMLYLHVDTIAGGATKLTVRLTRDTTGDQTIIGDAQATLSTGVTTATEGDVAFKIDVDYLHTDDVLYCFFKTDAGTCTVKKIELFWEE